MSGLSDPADKALDAQADGNFGGKDTSHRAGYGTVVYDGVEYDRMGWLLRCARAGHTLAAGEGAKIVAHYEQQLDTMNTMLCDQVALANKMEEQIDEACCDPSITRLENEQLLKQMHDPKALIAAVKKHGADRVKILGVDVLFLPPEMADA